MAISEPRSPGHRAGLEPKIDSVRTTSSLAAFSIFFFFFSLFIFIYLFILGCVGSSLLLAGFSLVAVSRGLLFVKEHGL